MNASDFKAIAKKEPRQRIDVNWDNDSNGYVICGPHGAYMEEGIPKVFPIARLKDVHRLIRDWGFTRFWQEGEEKAFPEDED
jgi:hypothetical protein